MVEVALTLIAIIAAFLFGKRQQKKQDTIKMKEQADAFNDAVEGSHAGGAAWADRLRKTDPMQRDKPKGR
jgi:hypothetical protein